MVYHLFATDRQWYASSQELTALYVHYRAIQYQNYIDGQKRQLIPQPQSGGSRHRNVFVPRGALSGLLQADLITL